MCSIDHGRDLGISRLAVQASAAAMVMALLTAASVLAVAAPWDERNIGEPESSLSEEEQQQIRTAERFLSVLQKNPRRGTALDRVYGHHVEFGTLDTFLQQLRQSLETTPADGAGWMLLGLFESQRGADADAVDAFRNAETYRTDDPMACYYLGQALIRIGESQAAVEAFERSLERQPQRTDLLEIFQQLGRVHQRAQRTEEALEVWQRLEALFPDDPRVLEQIAVTLAEEGQPLLAISRYEKLAQLARDDYRRVMFRIETAELRIKTSNRQQGVAELEQLLTDLNPDSWLFRDVRRRIENVFLRTGDQDSLVSYYQEWLAGHPEDVEAMARLAQFLASSARVPEAAVWMEKALRKAPTRTDLRRSFIDQLMEEQRIPEAIEQFALLAESAPGNSDILRDWGRLVLRDRTQTVEARQKQAADIWNRIVSARPDDALTAAQVADLFRHASIPDQALALYQKAVELAANEPQYREYLGEFYHIQKRPEEALRTWQAIAEPPRRNAANVQRLAEVYHSFGYTQQAVSEIAAACRMDPQDFSLQLRGADYHAQAGEFDQAWVLTEAADKLAASDDERESALKQQISILQSSQRLSEELEALSAAIRDNPAATVRDWQRLARYCEADRRWEEALDAVDAALALDPRSVSALGTAARIAEVSGDLGRAVEILRRLADVDRRARGDHLMNISRLETQLGRTDEALQAAQDLIVSAPGNTDHYEFYAQLCFRLGRAEEGLETLRKAVRINPGEPHLIMALAAALAEQIRTDEAIEVYWRAFEKSDDVEDKISLTMKLTPLYQQLNQFDRLIERFERDRREEDRRREMTLCLAQAWHTSGDLSAARQELESLLNENTRDTSLLNQLAKLCQQSADMDAAIAYQKQLAAIAPGHETEFPLAGMLAATGQRDDAREIFVRLTQREEDPVRLVKSIDSLLTQGNFEAVIGITEPLLSQQREDWELLYREGVAWAKLKRPDEAAIRFQRILSLALPHESLGRAASAAMKQAEAKARSERLQGRMVAPVQQQSAFTMLNQSSQVQHAVGLISENDYSGRQMQQIWTPGAYGIARLAAWGWLLVFERDRNPDDASAPTASGPGVADQINETALAADAPRNAIIDALYLARLQNDNETAFRLARRLAEQGGAEERRFFLSSLNLRGISLNAAHTSGQQVPDLRQPLPDDDLQLMMNCFEELQKDSTQVDASAFYGGNVAYGANGQIYVRIGSGYVPIAGAFRGSGFLSLVLDELKLAGRQQQADDLLEQHLAKAESVHELAAGLSLLLREDRLDQMPPLLHRWRIAALEQIAAPPTEAISRRTPSPAAMQSLATLATIQQTLLQWIGRLGADEEHAQVLSILDAALDVALAETDRRIQLTALARSASQNITQPRPIGYLQLYFGRENIQVQVNFPPVGIHMDHTTASLLRQVHEVFQRTDVLGDFTEHLRMRVEAASPAETLPLAWYLASALWWADEQDQAIEVLDAVAGTSSTDVDMIFQLATMHETRGNFEDALQLIESLVPRDQQLLQRRELAALQLAERLGDIQRARDAAERLFGLRLPQNVQLQLVDRMRRLGMDGMSDAILARAQRTTTNQPESLASMMMLYQGQGKTDQAIQLAHMLIRRTASTNSSASLAVRNPARYRTSTDTLRTQAIQLLHRSGELQKLIQQLETQTQRSPDAVPLQDQLLEFYTAAGQGDRAGELLQRALERRPDSPALRQQLAKHLEQKGMQSEACDQYLSLLQLQPDWVTDDLYQIRNVFARAQRTSDLLRALNALNIRNLRQPYYVIDLVRETISSGTNLEASLELMEKLFEAAPSYRQSLISNLTDERTWKNERVYELARKYIVPTETEIRANPWSGMDRIYSYSGDGVVSAVFHRMVQGLSGTERLTDLEKHLLEKTDALPEWYAGQAMLAVIEIKSGRREQARQRLERLTDNETAMMSVPAATCWLIGQELDGFEDTRATAMALYERAMTSDSQQSHSQIRYSPVSRLVSAYRDAGRRNDARGLMIRQLKSQPSSISSNQSYYAQQRVENVRWVADKLQSMQFPVDAVRLYRQLLNEPETLRLAAQENGRQPDYWASVLRTGMTKAMESLQDSDGNEAVNQLLQVTENPRPGETAFDLMVAFPDAAALKFDGIVSGFTDLLVSMSRNSRLAESIDQRLTSLRTTLPDDVSISLSLAEYRLRMEHPQAEESVRQLISLLERIPAEEIAPGRRANSRQRREAAILVQLWPLARHCLQEERLHDEGQLLAQRALDAAGRQITIQHSAAILYEWGHLLLKTGQRQQAEQKWFELLKLATERPERKTPAPAVETRTGQRAPDTPVDIAAEQPGHYRYQLTAAQNPVPVVPPLTMSQFRTTVLVARAAAEHEMHELSLQAVRESLRGGLPVADPSGDLLNASQPQIIRRSGSESNVNPIEAEVIASLKTVFPLWKSGNVNPQDVYHVLLPLILPETRPTEILLHADLSGLMQGRAESLGETLIDFAEQAGRLSELHSAIEERRGSPPATVPAAVLQTLIALRQKDMPAARQLLSELHETPTRQASVVISRTACYAAMQAFRQDELRVAAFPILQQTLQLELQSANPESGNPPDLNSKLARLVSDYSVQGGDLESVRMYFEQMLLTRQAYYSRYSGDYGLYMQRNDLVTIASQLAGSGLPEAALDFLGRALDFDVPRYAAPSSSAPLTLLSRHFRTLPAAERYEAWSRWTLPVEGRQTVRFIADTVSLTSPPAVFVSPGRDLEMFQQTRVLSNFSELVDAAVEAETLPQLKQTVTQLAHVGQPQANFLLALVLIAENDQAAAEPLIHQLLQAMPERLKTPANAQRQTAWNEYLIWQACLRSEQMAPLMEYRLPEFRTDLQRASQHTLLPLVNADWAARATTKGRQAPPSSPSDAADAGLVHWFAAPEQDSAGHVSAWWSTSSDQLVFLGGGNDPLLHFRYPLTGDFRFSVDCFHHSWAEGDVGFGGVTVQAQQSGTQSMIRALGTREQFNRPQAFSRPQPSFNRVTLESADGRMRYLLNNHLVYEEQLSATSPWLVLTTNGNRTTSFRNPTLTGSPRIPQQVPLLQGNQMDGWNCSTFVESQPRHRLMAEKPRSEDDSLSYYQRNEPTEFDWSTRDGVLRGRPIPDADPDAQSWIYYFRPLQNGESFHYEFYHTPDRTVAHPTVGRLAMLLQPDGIVSHWIGSPNWDERVHGIRPENAVVESSCQRGPIPLPLHVNDWNLVQLALNDGVVTVTLNEQLVFERPLDQQAGSRIGIYRMKTQEARVRNAMLTGDWPSAMPDVTAANLLATSRVASPDQRKTVSRILDDRMIAPLAGELVQQAKRLPADQAFEMLKKWVLPADDHDFIRLYVSQNPLGLYANAHRTTASVRDVSYGQQSQPEDFLLCPAVLLIQLAGRQNRMDELLAAVSNFQTDDPIQIRNRGAMQTLFALQQNDSEVARAGLQQAYQTLIEGLPQSLPAKDRMAEFVVAWQAGIRDDYWSAGADIARQLREMERSQDTRSNDESFRRLVHSLVGDIERQALGRAEYERASQATAAMTALTQWQSVPYLKPEHRWRGDRPSTWIYRRGSVRHLPAETWSQLYFQSPLRGTFEIHVDRSTHGHKELAVAWGMHSAEPRYDQKAVRVIKLMHSQQDHERQLNLPFWDQQADFRIRVDGSRVTTWTNGVLVHEETFSEPPDPWLVLQGHNASNFGAVRDLRIIGDPEIPEQIDLINLAGWAGWRADVYGEWFTERPDQDAPWKRSGEEIVGTLREDRSSEWLESLLMYQRPMLEDGMIEFETYYVPDEVECHPALGRTAFLLHPDGVHHHRLTDVQFETSDLQPNHSEAVPDAVTLPLKVGEWNRIRMQLQGSLLTLTVNDQQAAVHEVTEPASERWFGLFRYSSKTRARVRGLTYRGEWPRSLPPVSEQQLAEPDTDSSEHTELPVVLDVDLRSSAEALKSRGILLAGPEDRIHIDSAGVHLNLHDTQGGQHWPGIRFPVALVGDCDLSVTYQDLSIQPHREGWGNNLVFEVVLDDPQGTRVECNVSLNKDSDLTYKSQLLRQAPDANAKSVDHLAISGATASGRLRMCREGGQIHCFAAPDDASPFRLLASHTIGTAAIRQVACTAKCSDAAGKTTVTLSHFTANGRLGDQTP